MCSGSLISFIAVSCVFVFVLFCCCRLSMFFVCFYCFERFLKCRMISQCFVSICISFLLKISRDPINKRRQALTGTSTGPEFPGVPSTRAAGIDSLIDRPAAKIEDKKANGNKNKHNGFLSRTVKNILIRQSSCFCQQT